MKLWIIGAGGLVGGALVKRCTASHLNFTATLREQADVTDLSQLIRCAREIQPTHIINCAAYTNVDRAESEPELAFKINADGAANLATVAKECSAKLIHLSTDYVFDGKSTVPYKEEDPCSPLGVYGKSKREGEVRLLNSEAEICIIRSSWIFGRGGKNFISSILEAMKSKPIIKVVSDQRGSPTFSHDLAQAILKLLPHRGIFHFANQGELSRLEIARDILQEVKRLGFKVACEQLEAVGSLEFPTPAPRPAYSVLNCDKLANTLGWRPRPWKEILREYVYEC